MVTSASTPATTAPDTSQTTTTSTTSPTSTGISRGEIIGIVVAIVVVLIIIGVIVYFLKGRSDSSAQEGGVWGLIDDLSKPGCFADKLKQNKIYIMIIILALVVFVIFMINSSKNPNKQITEDDVNNFNQKMTEANKIAGLEPKNISSDTYSAAQKYNIYHSDNSESSDFRNRRFSESESIPQEETDLNDFYRPLL